MGLGPQHGIAGAILQGGSHISKKFESAAAGMNAVHAVAMQGHVDAHLRQQEHEHHLKSIEQAQKVAGKKGFEVRTGHNVLKVGRGKNAEGGDKEGGKPKGGKPETRNEETQGHYEKAKDRAHEERESASIPVQSFTERVNSFRPALEAPRKAIGPGRTVDRVNGAIPLGKSEGNKMENKTGNTQVIDSKTPQQFVNTDSKHFEDNARTRFDEIAARRKASGEAKA